MYPGQVVWVRHLYFFGRLARPFASGRGWWVTWCDGDGECSALPFFADELVSALHPLGR